MSQNRRARHPKNRGIAPTSEGQIRIYTRRDCEDSQAAKEFLEARRIAYQEVDIDNDSEAAEFVMRANAGKRRTPTVEIEGRTFHASGFDPRKFARDLGLDS